MTQFLLLFLAIAIPIGFLIFTCVLEPLLPGYQIRLASSMLRTKLPKGTTAIVIDDSPGLPFPGGASDGYTFLILQIPPKKIAEFTNTLEESPIWKPLPLPARLAENEHFLQPRIIGAIEETIPIDSSTGYYLFIDHQEEYNKAHDSQTYDTAKPFYERSSLNYTFGMFDDKTGKLYLWSLDT